MAETELSLMPPLVSWAGIPTIAQLVRVGSLPTSHASPGDSPMAHSLPALKFASDALEPFMDAQTVEIHHGKHHQTYVNNLNALVEGTEYADLSVEDLLRQVSQIPQPLQQGIRNQ